MQEGAMQQTSFFLRFQVLHLSEAKVSPFLCHAAGALDSRQSRVRMCAVANSRIVSLLD